MARPNGSRKIRGWIMTPTEMAKAGLIDPANLERVVQGKGIHAVEVTGVKPSAVKGLDNQIERLKERANLKDDKFAQKAIDSLVEAKRATNTPRSEIERKLFAEEKRIRNNGYETGVVVTPDGKVIRQKGEQFKVSLSPEQAKAMPGSVYTHNHPRAISDMEERRNPVSRKIGGDSLGPVDMGVLFHYKTKEMRAVTSKLEYSMKNKKWKQEHAVGKFLSEAAKEENYKRFRASYKTLETKTEEKLISLVRQGKLSPNEAVAPYWHLVARDFVRSKGTGQNYEYSVTGDRAALAELARIEKIYDEG